MATVEQCETQPSALQGISNTMNLFDTFKPTPEEDKDSDEESFHLPMLDCDEDLDSNNIKDNKSSGKGMNPDSEDDILEKFDSNGTSEVDLRTEKTILDEIDDILKKTDDTCADESKSNSGDSKGCKDDVKQESSNSIEDKTDSGTKPSVEDKKNIVEVVPKQDGEDISTAEPQGKESGDEEPKPNVKDDKILDDEESMDNGDNKKENDLLIEENDIKEEENMEVSNQEPEEESKKHVNEEMDKSEDETNRNIDNENELLKDEDVGIATKSVEGTQEQKMEIDEIGGKTPGEMETPTDEKPSEDGLKTSDETTSKPEDIEEKPPKGPAVAKPDQKNDVVPDKCENSNDSTKSQNESEDLWDISVIRDADEDNASAIAEDINDAHTSEKSDDNEDQDEGSDKADNDLEEAELEQEETLLPTDNDKEDNMDFEDGGSNLCDQDNAVGETVSDSEVKDDAGANVEMKDAESDSKDSSSGSALKEDVGFRDGETSSENLQTETETVESKDSSCQASAMEDSQESDKENVTKPSGKRSLSETDIQDSDSTNKKIRLTEKPATEAISTLTTKTLVTFEKFMQNKKFSKKLTMSDLEQFCLQKICEAIIHKTDVGELHQITKKQEQIIENLRKDIQQLTKQARDLDIVNKKLMSELRIQNGLKKPLVPLKITRSVGLQVKLNSIPEMGNRRKTSLPTTPRTPNTGGSAPARPRAVAAAASVVRQIAASPRKAAPTAPLLSQALQTRQIPVTTNTITKRQTIRPKPPAEPQKPANSGVIDLTDEDDRTSKGGAAAAAAAATATTTTPMKMISKTVPLNVRKSVNLVAAKPAAGKAVTNSNQNKSVAVGQGKAGNAKTGPPNRTVTTLPQGVRLTPTQVKGGSIAIPASVVTSNAGTTTQFMYVVQPGQVVTSTAGGGQKTVLLNFQPTNGVLTSALNGSTVSVVPAKTTNTVQLKTVPAARKHPAPLPNPPAVTLNASLKPLLPKPHLSIKKTDTGIILQWRMPYNLDVYEAIASYQLFAYQETSAAPSTDMWRKVGDVKALALPMACTLTQFADKNKYYFAVRSVDVHKRIGAFSDPEEISL